MEIIKVENLSFKYPLVSIETLNNISFTINDGDFVTLCGPTGCGKSTLLRLLKKELSPIGKQSGEIFLNNQNINDISLKTSSELVGFVLQNPDQQIVTDKVWHELAFGLENLNVSQNNISKRVAEMAAYFGIESWYDKNVNELSGGQKQLLNLASIMVMNPKILILDEPTAQLDPIAASNFIATLKKLNNDFSLTIIIVEHRLEEIIPISNRLLVLDRGKLIYNGTPKQVVENVKDNFEIINLLPSATRLFHLLNGKGECPLTVKEGRIFLEKNFNNHIKEINTEIYNHSSDVALQLKNVYFRYQKDSFDVLQQLNLTVFTKEIFCIVGGNGSGKSTTLKVASGLLKPYSGVVKVFNKKIKEYNNNSLYKNCLTLLPQDVQTVFIKNTVKEEFEEVNKNIDIIPFDITDLYNKHPYDLSGGEQQLVALAKVLLTKPKIILMDEPTKGLDANLKIKIINILKDLKNKGITIIIVTHDIEFASLCADRCALFFRGNIVATEETNKFFSENRFYTTTAARMTEGLYLNTITVDKIVNICNLNGKKDNNVSNKE